MSELYKQALQSHHKWDALPTDSEWHALFATCFDDGRDITLMTAARGSNAQSYSAIIDCGEYVRSVAVEFSEDGCVCILTEPISDWYWYKKGSGKPMVVNTPTVLYSMQNTDSDIICTCNIYDEASTKNFHRILANICRIPVRMLRGLPKLNKPR